MSRKCLAPFNSIVINPDGSAAPCCKYNLDRVDIDIQKESLRTKNIQELFDQPAMEKLRHQFLNGKEPSGCAVCWKEENAGMTSFRQAKNKSQGSFDDPKIKHIDFKFSTLCNLKCRICGPYCSSNWLKESLDTGSYTQHTIDIFSKYSERKFSDKDFEILEQLLPEMEVLEFYGGEPLMQPEHQMVMDILQKCPNLEYKELKYNTNGTWFNQNFVDVWNRFKNVVLNFSIDDMGKRFEYQRYPAVWNEVIANVQKYQEQTTDNVIKTLYITVSIYNVFYIDELIKYNAENFKFPYMLNLVHFPDALSIKHLPKNVKKVITKKLLSVPDEHLSYNTWGIKLVDVVNYMNSEDGDMEKFYEITTKHDQYRNQSFLSVFPELASLLDD